jgi:hypothetical protein
MKLNKHADDEGTTNTFDYNYNNECGRREGGAAVAGPSRATRQSCKTCAPPLWPLSSGLSWLVAGCGGASCLLPLAMEGARKLGLPARPTPKFAQSTKGTWPPIPSQELSATASGGPLPTSTYFYTPLANHWPLVLLCASGALKPSNQVPKSEE